MHITQILRCLQCFVSSINSPVEAAVRLDSVGVVVVDGVFVETEMTVERRVLTRRAIGPDDDGCGGVLGICL